MKDLPSCNELLVYFVTGEQQQPNWEHYLKHTLLKHYNVLPAFLEIGPRPA